MNTSVKDRVKELERIALESQEGVELEPNSWNGLSLVEYQQRMGIDVRKLIKIIKKSVEKG